MAIAIWQPKYCTKEVLVDVSKVSFGRNELFFCCDDALPSLYSFDGNKVITEAKATTNGRILCYAIPMGWLTEEGPLPEKYQYVKDRERAKWMNAKEKTKRRKPR